MMPANPRKSTPGPSTRSVHTDEGVDRAGRTIVAPVYANSAFHFDSIDAWRRVAEGKSAGDIYSRNSNPTTRRFEERMAALEGAEAATAFASGMAAISATLFALVEPGQTVVSVRDSYGATYLHFTEILPKFGVTCRLVDTTDHDAIIAAIAAGCRLLYLETPTNPTLKVLDLGHLIPAAGRAGALTVVDNTFATPINQNPIALGADLVIHSATKYLCGHGDVLGGVVCGSRSLVARIYRYRELTGPTLDPGSAHLLLRSLKTLGLRIARQNSSALDLARFLSAHAKVARVYYPGLESHAGHETARGQMRGFGGVVSFELHGGMAAVERFLPALRYAYLAPNLGQVETVAGPAALTSHVELTEAERQASGVPDSLIRYAVGIEDCDDLRADLEQALAQL